MLTRACGARVACVDRQEPQHVHGHHVRQQPGLRHQRLQRRPGLVCACRGRVSVSRLACVLVSSRAVLRRGVGCDGRDPITGLGTADYTKMKAVLDTLP